MTMMKEIDEIVINVYIVINRSLDLHEHYMTQFFIM